MIDTTGIITPHTSATYEALRESIAANGQHQPVLLAGDGSVIDGNSRLRACAELGIPPMITTLPTTDPVEIRGFVLLHNTASGRHPVPAERDAIVLAMHERGMTMREVADATGVSTGLVAKITKRSPSVHREQMATGPARRVDRSGRSQPVRRTTTAELARRDEIIARLYRAGHSGQEIADALDISSSSAADRVRAMGAARPQRTPGIGPVTEPCSWRDEDMPRDVATLDRRWQRSSVISMAQMLDDDFRETSFASLLANHVTEAVAAHDVDWLREAHKVIDAAYEKLGRARRILDDPGYRKACQGDEGFEDLREGTEPVRLRAVP